MFVAERSFPLFAMRGGYCLIVVSRLFIVVTSLVVVHRFWGRGASVVASCGSVVGAPRYYSRGSIVEVHGSCCFMVCGIFPNQ